MKESNSNFKYWAQAKERVYLQVPEKINSGVEHVSTIVSYFWGLCSNTPPLPLWDSICANILKLHALILNF